MSSGCCGWKWPWCARSCNGWQGGEGRGRNALLPDLDDYSASAIKKAVRDESLLHPMTLYPLALGTLSGMAAFLYDLPLLFAGMGGLLAVGAATSIVNYFFRDDAISRNYLESLSRVFGEQRKALLETLGRDLERCRQIAGAEQYAEQGIRQFGGIQKKYAKLDALLKKFSATELAYGSYLGAAEQVYLSVLDNLMRIVSLLQGASAIDPEYINHRHQALQRLKEVDEADEREFETLKKRKELRTGHLRQVNHLLTVNEESMTIMDETSGAIAALETGNGLARVDMDTAMGHLRELAGRVNRYQHHQ